ncbi:LamG-like jellyroll fold domain-containing protein [Planctomycetota bacterium]
MVAKSKTNRVLWLILILGIPAWTLAQSASDLLQDAIYAEDIEGDLNKAITLYDQVIESEAGKRPYKAQALFRKGMCYLKQNNENKARATFERLEQEYADQSRILVKAKTILEDLTIVDPASLMPPDTLAYFEIGSPGKQVETIFQMLKGAGVEDPSQILSMFGGGDMDKSPSDMLAAFFNPSMMAELKKIRGMAAGIVGINEEEGEPIGLIVLYPGESDALRGFLEAGIRMAAKPSARIGDMEILSIEDEVTIALDDQAILVSQSRAHLERAVRQYRGLSRAASLADQQSFFDRVSKKARQDSTFTLWANADGIYDTFMTLTEKHGLPDEFHAVNTMLDLANLDELVAQLSIRPDGIHADVTLNLKPEHQCLLYNLIHTPNITSAALATVPPDAILMASFALGEKSSPAEERLQGSLEQLTGLDIGREIFANIEQVNLFAVAPRAELTQMPPEALVSCVGLAITSAQPEKTRQLLQGLLDTMVKASAGTTSTPVELDPGLLQYNVSIAKGQTISCYLGQRGKSTVLTLDADLARRTLSQSRRRPTGALKKPVEQISDETSKLIGVNLGGILGFIDVLVEAQHQNPQNPGHQALRDMATVCAQTTLQLRTDEGTQHLRLHLALDGIPGLDSIVGPGMILSQVDITGKTRATNPQPGPQGMALPGSVTLKWKPGVMSKTHKVYLGTSADALTFLGDTSKPNSQDLKPLEVASGKTYYWRVDEVWEDGTVITGSVWSFKTAKPLAHYTLNGINRNISDESGNGHHGTLVGTTTWIEGSVGKALLIQDANTYVEIPGAMSTFENGFTFALWAKPTGNGIWARFLEFGSGAPKYNITFGRENSTDNLVLEIYGERWCERVNATNALTLNAWHHYATTCDDQGRVVMYKDGKRVSTGHISKLHAVERTHGYLAKSSWRENIEYQGGLDDVRIYETALNATAIKALFSQGAIVDKDKKVDKSRTEKKKPL